MTDRDLLIEAAATAFRPRDPSGHIQSAPAWHDLDDAGRTEAFAHATRLRRLEAAYHPDGLSNTARLLLERIRSTAQ